MKQPEVYSEFFRDIALKMLGENNYTIARYASCVANVCSFMEELGVEPYKCPGQFDEKDWNFASLELIAKHYDGWGEWKVKKEPEPEDCPYCGRKLSLNIEEENE